MEKAPITKKIGLYLIHPASIALYFWVLFLFLVPDIFQKYNVEIIRKESLLPTEKYYYRDINDDGISEIVKMRNNNPDYVPNIQVFDFNYRIYNQWNLNGLWLTVPELYIGDYDKNGLSEVFIVTSRQDSMFLSVIDPLGSKEFIKKDKFLGKSYYYNGIVSAQNGEGKFIDINNDGLLELVFTVNAGFSLQPRNVFTYYVNEDSLVVSPYSGTTVYRGLTFMDLNGDDVPELSGQVSAVENIHFNIPHSDSNAWLHVYDLSKMDYLFPSVCYKYGIGTSVDVEFFHFQGERFIGVTLIIRNAKLKARYILQIYDIHGNIVSEREYKQEPGSTKFFINNGKENSNYIYLIDHKGRIFKSDIDLNMSLIADTDSPYWIRYDKKMVLDMNNKKQIVYPLSQGQAGIRIYFDDYQDFIDLKFEKPKYTIGWHCEKVKLEDSSDAIHVMSGNDSYVITFESNIWYNAKYLLYIIAYFLLAGLFYLIQFTQRRYATQKLEEERMLLSQQMALSKKQLEPHFMLNTLNNIGHMFATENREKGMYYFERFASLIHRGLLYADKSETSLFEELEFVRDYLSLQQSRFNNDFEFIIEADDNIDLNSIMVPHSLVYTFVENSIKHGLRPSDKEKKLDVLIGLKNGKIVVQVIDNGIGRKLSKRKKTSGTSKGLGIITTIISSYNKMNNRSVSYQIRDNDISDGSGTIVEIVL